MFLHTANIARIISNQSIEGENPWEDADPAEHSSAIDIMRRVYSLFISKKRSQILGLRLSIHTRI